MDTSMIILIGIVVIGFVVVFFQLNRTNKPGENSPGDQSMKLLLEQMNELSRVVDRKMGETTQQMSEIMRNQFSESTNLIKNITESVTKLEETNKQVVSFADQLQNLQDILKNPKQRGILGEYYLETLLKNVLAPNQYEMQYMFSNKEVVDAVVKIKDKIIPIDSKFSLENYNRLTEAVDPSEKLRLEKAFLNDLKLRITETAKYIRPQEGTMEFAFMFIPHEAIYYDLLINKVGAVSEDTENLIQRAARKYKVIIVSPTSFLAYLQTVLQGLKAMQIEESAKQIKINVENLQKHLRTYEEYHTKIGTSLGTVVNHYNASTKEFVKIDKDIMRITGDSILNDVELLDKPNLKQD
jgi:DNA recombination protein RmuC